MKRNWLHRVCAIGALTVLAAVSDRALAQASTADAIRGGWAADAGGARHIFILVVRDSAVTGVYCAVDCGDPARLALIERGALTSDGVRFQIRWLDGASPARSDVVGRIADGRLSLTLASGARRPGVPQRFELQRDPRKPKARTVEELFASRGIQSGPLLISGSSTPYVPPGPEEPLSPAVLDGLWVWSNGPGKQHFVFRQVGEGLMGVVCGPCDNPWTFGPLDNFAIRGGTLTFDIIHEDWGIGIEFGPFVNHATATLSRHELHLRTVQQNGPRTIQGDLVLTGPLRTAKR